MKGPIQSVEVSYFLHATEDQERVNSAVMQLTAAEVGPEVEEVEGHYGNKIVMVRLHLTGDDAARAVRRIAERLPDQLKDQLTKEMGAHLDEHSALFLRFDKQRLVSGSLALVSADPVRVKVKPRIFLIRGGAPLFYSKLLREGG